MKKLLLLIATVFFMACDSEDALDCFQTKGDTITTEFTVAAFSKIRIEDDVSLIIRQGDVQEVLIETGENLLNDVSVRVEGGTLIVKDGNRCNFVRDFGITKAIVTTPVLTEIRNSSEFHVVGEGVLRFPFLELISNTEGGIEDSRKSGDFTMTIDCQDFRVDANGYSGFYIDGFAEKASIAFQDEVPRFEGPDLIINDLRILHRSANKMIVNPQERIRGQILSTGDVISLNRPPIVDVEEIYTGRLIFQD
ncbi:DUF2807 domain-containing protein [Aureisphaera galaxeae]|uniref:head GIN domain-containing protein n=1 Tax=Aureisphaera galaxeae TaxID=1538023 RepID=UPI00235018C0|nr:head GIN domain-containing protein [Aureisphaera galaxeae]MDC8003161.1 DUF2807 domain-containing protein [Aureisphaera galaxeae]